MGRSRSTIRTRRRGGSSPSGWMPSPGCSWWSTRGGVRSSVSSRPGRPRAPSAASTPGESHKGRVRLQRGPAGRLRSPSAGEAPHHHPAGRRRARLVPRPGGGGGRRELPDAHQRGVAGVRAAAEGAAGGDAPARAAGGAAPLRVGASSGRASLHAAPQAPLGRPGGAGAVGVRSCSGALLFERGQVIPEPAWPDNSRRAKNRRRYNGTGGSEPVLPGKCARSEGRQIYPSGYAVPLSGPLRVHDYH